MTEEMQTMLERQLKAARSPEEITRAQSDILLALMDCQRKTGDRVRELVISADRAKERVKGAQLLWDVLKVVGGAGGGAMLLRALGAG